MNFALGEDIDALRDTVYRWAKDKLFGMPEKVNEFYAAGREIYLQRMDTVISRVADIVGGDLTRAKQRIAAGRKDVSYTPLRAPETVL